MGDFNHIASPHLNAEMYRKDVSYPEFLSYLDYICVNSDGTTLVGCSELTGRYWTGGVKIDKNIDQACAKKPVISLKSGSADGCFIQSSDKVFICEDSGAVSVWKQGDSAWSSWDESVSAAEHNDSVLTVDCVEPDKFYVTASADGNVKVWDINEMICERDYLDAHSMSVSSVAVKPSSNTSFVSGALDSYVTLWDIKSKAKVKDLAILDCGVRCVQWLNDNTLLTGDEAGTLKLIDIRNSNTHETLSTFPAPIHRINIHKETKNIAVCCDNKTVTVHKLSEDNKLNCIYKGVKHDKYVRGMAWHITDNNKLHTVGWDGKLQTHEINV